MNEEELLEYWEKWLKEPLDLDKNVLDYNEGAVAFYRFLKNKIRSSAPLQKSTQEAKEID